jgi:hypothetical protein
MLFPRSRCATIIDNELRSTPPHSGCPCLVIDSDCRSRRMLRPSLHPLWPLINSKLLQAARAHVRRSFLVVENNLFPMPLTPTNDIASSSDCLVMLHDFQVLVRVWNSLPMTSPVLFIYIPDANQRWSSLVQFNERKGGLNRTSYTSTLFFCSRRQPLHPSKHQKTCCRSPPYAQPTHLPNRWSLAVGGMIWSPSTTKIRGHLSHSQG